MFLPKGEELSAFRMQRFRLILSFKPAKHYFVIARLKVLQE